MCQIIYEMLDSKEEENRTQDGQVPDLAIVVQNLAQLQLGKLTTDHGGDVEVLI